MELMGAVKKGGKNNGSFIGSDNSCLSANGIPGMFKKNNGGSVLVGSVLGRESSGGSNNGSVMGDLDLYGSESGCSVMSNMSGLSGLSQSKKKKKRKGIKNLKDMVGGKNKYSTEVAELQKQL